MENNFWTDEKIREKAEEWETVLIGHANFSPADFIEAAMAEIRDDMQKKINYLIELGDSAEKLNIDLLMDKHAEMEKYKRPVWRNLITMRDEFG